MKLRQSTSLFLLILSMLAVLNITLAQNNSSFMPITTANMSQVQKVFLFEHASSGGEDSYYSEFSPDSSVLATGIESDFEVKLWDINTQVLLKTIEVPEGLGRFTFSPDGKFLVIGSYAYVDPSLGLYEIEVGKITRTFSGFELMEARSESITDIAFSPDGSLMAAGTFDGTIRIWNLESGNILFTFNNGNTAGNNNVSFNSDGSQIYSYDRSEFKHWDLITEAEIQNELAFSSVKQVFQGDIWVSVTASDFGGHNVVNLSSPETGFSLLPTAMTVDEDDWVFHPVDDWVFHPNGDILAVTNLYQGGSGGDYLRLLNIVDDEEFILIKPWKEEYGDGGLGPPISPPELQDEGQVGYYGGFKQVRAMAFSPDGKFLATFHGDGVVRIWGIPAS